MKLILAIIIFTIKVNSSQAMANIIDHCGNYLVQGFYTKMSDSRSAEDYGVLMTDKGTESQINFRIQIPKELEEGKFHLSKYFLQFGKIGFIYELVLKISSPCQYHCDAEIQSVNWLPLEKARSFIYPSPQPIRGTEFPCH